MENMDKLGQECRSWPSYMNGPKQIYKVISHQGDGESEFGPSTSLAMALASRLKGHLLSLKDMVMHLSSGKGAVL